MAKTKIERDTGGGCSVCGQKPAVNVEGTYWLCAECAVEEMERYEALYKAALCLMREWMPL
jgi:hypothetical protein